MHTKDSALSHQAADAKQHAPATGVCCCTLSATDKLDRETPDEHSVPGKLTHGSIELRSIGRKAARCLSGWPSTPEFCPSTPVA